MNQEIKSKSFERRKEKKKKRSSQADKKKKRSRDHRDHSNEHKKKDKDKKKHKSKSKDRQKEDRRDKEKQRQPEYPNPKEYDGQKQKQRHKQKDREREKQHRQKNRDSKDRDRNKQKQKYRQRQRSRERSKKKDRSRSKKKDIRERSSQRRQTNNNDRFRDKGNNKDKVRQDKYQRWRKEAHFRFDSPPKSDQSDMSDDPQKMDKLNKMKAQKQLVTSKADKKLYLGNLPPNITSNQLMQMLNSALKKMEINCQSDGDSIVSAWISPDGVGHYAFVQFRTAQEATAGLALNGASLYGYQLKLGRPKQYIEYHKQLLSEFGSDGNIDTILRKVQAMGGFLTPPIIEERMVYPPSRILCLKHIVTIQELAIDQQYIQILEDVTEMAKRHGDILSTIIPRPMEIDLQQVKTRVKGLGYIFIKYKTVEQSKYARKEFTKCMFSQRSVTCSYFPQKRFNQGDLDVIDKIVIDF